MVEAYSSGDEEEELRQLCSEDGSVEFSDEDEAQEGRARAGSVPEDGSTLVRGTPVMRGPVMRGMAERGMESSTPGPTGTPQVMGGKG